MINNIYNYNVSKRAIDFLFFLLLSDFQLQIEIGLFYELFGKKTND